MTVLAAARSLIVALSGFLAGLMLAALAIPLAAHAAAPPPAAVPTPDAEHPEVSIIIYGDDPCPKGNGNEIVVCSRQPESERYRIPKRFRGRKAETSPAGNSWASKARSTEDASRTAAGLPNTCSPVGTGGQTGCYEQFLQQAARQRAQQKQDAQDIP